jgi:hypothetical protein
MVQIIQVVAAVALVVPVALARELLQQAQAELVFQTLSLV